MSTSAMSSAGEATRSTVIECSIVSFGMPAFALQGARLALDSSQRERADCKEDEDGTADEQRGAASAIARGGSRRLLSWRRHRDARQRCEALSRGRGSD